ncbi:MAG: GFA family protein [Pseudomonadota bacterium]
MKIDGQCHCGRIRFEAEVDPTEVYVCHCTDCQAISGGAYRWAASVPAKDFTLLSGTPKVYAKTAENHQHFCGDCASPLYGSSPTNGHSMLRLRLGTVRQRDRLPPRAELWCRSAQPWAEVAGGTERLDQQ